MVNTKSILVSVVLVFLISVASAAGGFTYCCEKTVDGAWCQNEKEVSRCDTRGDLHDPVPTSCEATSYCKMGCCFNSQEGTCMPNTPQSLCQQEEGVWEEDAECDIPQCTLGCCIIGDQAGFVTQTRCKRLSYLYGIENDFRTSISSEMECFDLAGADIKGACVFEEEYEKTCQLLTRKECKELGSETSFHEDYLCSAETLGTNCGPTQKTTCVEGRDEVYYLDSCGNLANIYDSTKHNNKDYWTKIYDKEDSCGFDAGDGNAGSTTCGNCNYYLGSTCKQYDRYKDRSKARYGDNICRDLSCNYKGNTYEHGETWCVKNSELENVPGSEYFRFVCFNSEVTIEPCAAFRQETCVETEVNNFKAAKCRANLWRDCIVQVEKEDCEDIELRDCEWKRTGNKDSEGDHIFACVPKESPGLDFWNAEGEAEEICEVAEQTCQVKFEKTGWDALTGRGEWKCVENCHCCSNADGDYEGCTGEKQTYHDALCEALGDCGTKKNYLGIKGREYDERSWSIS